MKHRTFFRAVPLAAILALAACGKADETAAPPPRPITADAIAQFCDMAVTEHAGPKGQIFVKSRSDPYWFASVRDAFAFTMLPEEPKDIVAIYVSDMAKEKDWNNPTPTNWVEARSAVFVIDSRKQSGMSEAEAVPFSDAEAAKRFVAKNGGRMVQFHQMPRHYILPKGDVPPAAPQKMEMRPNDGTPEMGAKPGAAVPNSDMKGMDMAPGHQPPEP